MQLQSKISKVCLLNSHRTFQGAFWGGLTGLIGIGIVVFTAQYYIAIGALRRVPKPVSVAGCSAALNVSLPNVTSPVEHASEPFFLFRISHYYYTLLGATLTMSVAYAVSLFTEEEKNPVRPEVVSSLVRRFIPKEKESNLDDVQYSAVHKSVELVKCENQAQ